MHEIFGQKPWVEPLATAGSSVTETKDNIENDNPTRQGISL